MVTTDEHQRDFRMIPTLLLSVVLFESASFALVASFLIFIVQLRSERVRMHREARSAKARRLRWTSTGEEVVLGPPIIADATTSSLTSGGAFLGHRRRPLLRC
jgi:hypothetical protein